MSQALRLISLEHLWMSSHLETDNVERGSWLQPLVVSDRPTDNHTTSL